MKINKTGNAVILIIFVLISALVTGVAVFLILTTPRQTSVVSQKTEVSRTTKISVSPTAAAENVAVSPTAAIENIDTKLLQLEKEAGELDETDRAIDVMN